MPLVLGIESSCDETAAAVVADSHQILSNVIASQIDLHTIYGGVVPELACRRHIEVIIPVIDQALTTAGCQIEDIDLIAVAKGPGLIGALLIGINAAKGLALAAGKPLVGVNHIEAHLYAAMMGKSLPLPALGVVISGGHTSLVEIKELGCYKLIGQTTDDAVGEAFDKVANLLGLPYPGGPQIEKLATLGDHKRYPFKAGVVKGRPLDFSFSGLKTNVLYTVKGVNANRHSPLIIQDEDKKDVAASFQYAALQDIVKKTLLAAQSCSAKAVVLGGGVSQSSYLRKLFAESGCDLPFFWPTPGLCLDNAAMIAGLGFPTYQQIQRSEVFTLQPSTRLPFS